MTQITLPRMSGVEGVLTALSGTSPDRNMVGGTVELRRAEFSRHAGRGAHPDPSSGTDGSGKSRAWAWQRRPCWPERPWEGPMVDYACSVSVIANSLVGEPQHET